MTVLCLDDEKVLLHLLEATLSANGVGREPLKHR